MDELKLCDSDYAVMNIIWTHGHLSSRSLVDHCAQELGWKKSTTYTVLKKLCDRGFAENRDSTVSPLIPRERVQAYESHRIVDRSFSGSLPKFLVSFLEDRKLTLEEARELLSLIEQHKEG